MYEDKMEEKINRANAEWEKKESIDKTTKLQGISFMERLLGPIKLLQSGRIYEIGNGEDYLRIVNSDDNKIEIMYSSGSSSDDKKNYSYDELAKDMTDEVIGFPSLLKGILQSSFDEIIIEKLT